MTIRVLFFAYLRDVTGVPAVELEVADGAALSTVATLLVQRWPGLREPLARLPVVLNGNLVDASAAVPLPPGAELAWLPPVGGGSPGTVGQGPGVVLARITAGPLSPSRLLSQVEAPTCGGIVVFVGEVRDREGDRPVTALTYDAYATLAQTQVEAVAAEAALRWPMARIAVEHRVGRLTVGEVAVVVAVACPHRADAFDCCRTVIDRVKEAVPVWKQEESAAGSRWLPGHDYRPTAPADRPDRPGRPDRSDRSD